MTAGAVGVGDLREDHVAQRVAPWLPGVQKH